MHFCIYSCLCVVTTELHREEMTSSRTATCSQAQFKLWQSTIQKPCWISTFVKCPQPGSFTSQGPRQKTKMVAAAQESGRGVILLPEALRLVGSSALPGVTVLLLSP